MKPALFVATGFAVGAAIWFTLWFMISLFLAINAHAMTRNGQCSCWAQWDCHLTWLNDKAYCPEELHHKHHRRK